MKVTIRVERADGQFTVAQADVPDVVPTSGYGRGEVAGMIAGGFVRAWIDCAELPQ